MRYLVSDLTDSDNSLHGEVVDQEFVDAYVSIETRRFFINLGGTEEYRKTKTGIVVLTSTNPDGAKRAVKFTPVSGNQEEG